MIYLYNCDLCETEVDIYKPVSECSNEEYCETCSNLLTRVYTPTQFNMGFIPGNMIKSKSQRDKMLDDYERKNGTRPVCIGDEKINNKPVSKPITISEETKKDMFQYLDQKCGIKD